MTTTTDWASVGGDPAPGDVAAFDALARAFDGTADDASDAQRSLERLASNVQSDIWEGEAADAFRDKIKELPPQLRQLHDSYDTASGALRSYGSTLSDLKRRAATALAEAGAAEAEQTSSAQAAAQAVAVDPEAPTAQYDQALANARQRLSSARSEVERIREERKSAETRLVGRLRDASDKGIQNERWGGFTRFLKAIGDACELIALVITVIAVVVIVVVALTNPIGWAALAAGLAAAGPLLTAASVLGGVAFATKVGRLALGDESVSKASLALDAGLMLAGPAGKLGGRVFRGLSAAGRTTNAGKGFLKTGSRSKKAFAWLRSLGSQDQYGAIGDLHRLTPTGSVRVGDRVIKYGPPSLAKARRHTKVGVYTMDEIKAARRDPSKAPEDLKTLVIKAQDRSKSYGSQLSREGVDMYEDLVKDAYLHGDRQGDLINHVAPREIGIDITTGEPTSAYTLSRDANTDTWHLYPGTSTLAK